MSGAVPWPGFPGPRPEIHDAYVGTRWRRGRKVGRTIYWQRGETPSDEDPLIGIMDAPELAEIVVHAVNEWLKMRSL